MRLGTLLLISLMVPLSGIPISPAQPFIKTYFEHTPHVTLFINLLLPLTPLSTALFSPLMGYIIDRFGRRWIILLSLFLFSLAGLSGYVCQDLGFLLISRFIMGAALAGGMTASTALIADYYDPAFRQRVIGFQTMVFGLGANISVLIGGYLLTYGWRAPFIIYAFTLVIFLLAIFVIKEPKRSSTKATISPPAIPFPLKRLAPIYILSFLSMLVFYSLVLHIPFFLYYNGIAHGMEISLALSIGTIGQTLIGLTFKNIRQYLSRTASLGVAFVLFSAGLVWVGGTSTYLSIILGSFIGNMGLGLLMPTLTSWLTTITPEIYRGRALGGYITFIFLGQGCSPIIGYFLSQDNHTSSILFLWVGMIILFAATLYIARLLRHKR